MVSSISGGSVNQAGTTASKNGAQAATKPVVRPEQGGEMSPVDRIKERKFREKMREKSETPASAEDATKLGEPNSSADSIPKTMEELLAEQRQFVSEDESALDTLEGQLEGQLEGLLEGQQLMGHQMTTPSTSGLVAVESTAAVGSLAQANSAFVVDELVSSIMVSDPKSANPEIRIEVNPELLPETQIVIRWESGTLQVEMVSQNPEVSAFLAAEENNLEIRLSEALDVSVDVQIDGGDTTIQLQNSEAASDFSDGRSDEQSSGESSEQGRSGDDSNADDEEQQNQQSGRDHDEPEW